MRRLDEGPLHALRDPVHLRVNGGKGVLDVGVPLFERGVGRLKDGDAFVALLLVLAEACVLEIKDALLEIAQAVGEVAASIVGDDRGRVLRCGVELQGAKTFVDG